jgi:hypothetical protein
VFESLWDDGLVDVFEVLHLFFELLAVVFVPLGNLDVKDIVFKILDHL